MSLLLARDTLPEILEDREEENKDSDRSRRKEQGGRGLPRHFPAKEVKLNSAGVKQCVKTLKVCEFRFQQLEDMSIVLNKEGFCDCDLGKEGYAKEEDDLSNSTEKEWHFGKE